MSKYKIVYLQKGYGNSTTTEVEADYFTVNSGSAEFYKIGGKCNGCSSSLRELVASFNNVESVEKKD